MLDKYEMEAYVIASIKERWDAMGPEIREELGLTTIDNIPQDLIDKWALKHRQCELDYVNERIQELERKVGSGQ